jgi:hypothetical protein
MDSTLRIPARLVHLLFRTALVDWSWSSCATADIPTPSRSASAVFVRIFVIVSFLPSGYWPGYWPKFIRLDASCAPKGCPFPAVPTHPT